MTAIIRKPADFRRACDDARAASRQVGLVPTMGALHEGHFSLIDEAKKRADFVVVTIFVNPLQFAPGEDLGRYPRTMETDLAGCRARDIDLVFAPEPDFKRRFRSQRSPSRSKASFARRISTG